MGKTGQFLCGVITGLVLGALILVFGIGFWTYEHHMFILGITNRAAFFGGLIAGIVGLIVAIILLGLASGRMNKRSGERRLDA